MQPDRRVWNWPVWSQSKLNATFGENPTLPATNKTLFQQSSILVGMSTSGVAFSPLDRDGSTTLRESWILMYTSRFSKNNVKLRQSMSQSWANKTMTQSIQAEDQERICLCFGLAKSKSWPNFNWDAVAGPEAGTSWQTPLKPHSIGWALYGGVGKNLSKQMSETD